MPNIVPPICRRRKKKRIEPVNECVPANKGPCSIILQTEKPTKMIGFYQNECLLIQSVFFHFAIERSDANFQ